MQDLSNLVVYSDGELELKVSVEKDSVWLNRNQLAELFGRDVKTIGKHINNVFNENELTRVSTVANFATVQIEGGREITRDVEYYNLDVIISIGYRVKSQINKINSKIKENILEFNQNIFFYGQIYDAYSFVNDLLKLAKSEIILIDNYIDDTVFTLFSKYPNINFTIYTSTISKQLKLDFEKYSKQYKNISLKTFKSSHDRFLIIDKKDIYHLGASLKDLGKKWFAFSKMSLNSLNLDEIFNRLK